MRRFAFGLVALPLVLPLAASAQDARPPADGAVSPEIVGPTPRVRSDPSDPARALPGVSLKAKADATADAKPPPLSPPPPVAQRLDALFGDLKRERNPKAAEKIAGRISNEWARSGSDTVDLMMGWAKKGIDAKKYDVALDFLDQVTVLAPDYAEGWNLRATAHFLRNDYSMSMQDIDRTLRLEPRHFGALMGLAMILKNTDHKPAALDAYERVLSLYPMNRAAQNEVAALSDELAGQSL